MSKKTTLALAALAIGAGLAGSAAPASASSCSAVVTSFYTAFSCVMHANTTNHFIHVSTGAYVTVDAIDWNSLITVYHGSAGFWGIEKTVTGLYGEYYLAATSVLPTGMTLSND